MKYDKMSIEDLCKPLSAKVMPESMLFTSDHQPRDNDEALQRARQRSASKAASRMKQLMRNAK